MPNISILFITYNSAPVITRLLKLFKGYEKTFKYVVVDNASTDNTVELLKKDFPFVKIIAEKQNRGYGIAANLWLHQADSDYVLLLNPDIEVNPADIQKLIDIAEQYDAVLTSPAIAARDYTPDREFIEDVEWICGAAMLFNMKHFKAEDFFDPNIFLYFEDDDLCERLLKAGKKMILAHHIYFPHEGGGSSGSSEKIIFLKAWHFSWSRAYYFKKHASSFKAKYKNISGIIRHSYKFLLNLILFRRKKYKKNLGNLSGNLAFLKGLKPCDTKGNPRGMKS